MIIHSLETNMLRCQVSVHDFQTQGRWHPSRNGNEHVKPRSAVLDLKVIKWSTSFYIFDYHELAAGVCMFFLFFARSTIWTWRMARWRSISRRAAGISKWRSWRRAESNLATMSTGRSTTTISLKGRSGRWCDSKVMEGSVSSGPRGYGVFGPTEAWCWNQLEAIFGSCCMAAKPKDVKPWGLRLLPFQRGDRVHWDSADKDIPAGSIGRVRGIKYSGGRGRSLYVNFLKGAWSFPVSSWA